MFFYSLHTKKIVEGNWKWKRKGVLHNSLSNFLLVNRESCRGMGRKQPKIRSRWRSLFSRPFAWICVYNVTNVVHQKSVYYKSLCRCRMKKNCTGKLQMKRKWFSDERSGRIKEWAETIIVHLTIGCRTCQWKTLKIVHCWFY